MAANSSQASQIPQSADMASNKLTADPNPNATNHGDTPSQERGQDSPQQRQDEDGGTADKKKVKTERQLEKERRKQKKLAKDAENQSTNAGTLGNVTTTPKTKEKKAKQDSVKEESMVEYHEETPPGQKKILRPLDDPRCKSYNPKVVESAWFAWWDAQGFFQPEFGPDGRVKKEGYFVMPEPPPNVTGVLHMGHALTGAVQDLLIRWNRMRGLTTLWVPGCDHAGIATQTVVENMLRRRQNKSRHDLGRRKFNELVWDWKEEYHSKINEAHNRMGESYDWTREAFTMDANLSAAVSETFVRLHDEGIIYRANRLVNWCTQLNTALSNLEVVNQELQVRTLLDVPGYDRKVEFGVLIHFQYEMDGSDEKIEVATTRPETMLGDTGIAVHPNDERYKKYIGKNARHPFVDRLLPIVADDYVDPEFGTGAVKLTPAHDPNDFALGTRHQLEFVNILNDDGTLNANAGKYQGTRRFDARYTVVEDLKAKGLYVKKEDNPMKVPRCDRSKDVIEPIIRPQWWMRMRGMADAAIDVVKRKEIVVRPESAEKSYFRWLEDINDWCISRQLWWGHQAPVYLVKFEDELAEDNSEEVWVAGRTEQEAEQKALARFPELKFTLRRDEDVLDTWFSSALWPFSTLGWPKKTSDFVNLYPTSLLETGWDILFFWVARMIMLGLKMTGTVPFREVYCHALIRDSEGRKMSKSLGNVIDPKDVIDGISLDGLHAKLTTGNLDPKEIGTATKFQKAAFPDGIPQCGADALRFSLVAYVTGGGNINFDVKVIYGYRKFCNKIYQATKYVLSKLNDDFVPYGVGTRPQPATLAERWILHKFSIAAKEINQALTEREFQRSALIVYQFWYNHLCDVYLENSKAIIQGGSKEEGQSARNTLYTALEGALTMIHPFMPFISEELWQRLPRRPGDSTPSIVKAAYPQHDPLLEDSKAEAAYDLVLDVAKGIRSLMSEYSIREDGKVLVQTFNDASFSTVKEQVQSIRSLSAKGVASIDVLSKEDDQPSGCVVFAVSSQVNVSLHVKGRVDIDEEVSKLNNKLKRASDGQARQQKIINDPAYQQKVGPELQEVELRKLRDLDAEVRTYQESLAQFERLRLD